MAVLIALLRLGSICVISIARTLQFVRLAFLNPTVDTTPDVVIITTWTMLEVNVAVICACLTTIKPALARLFPRLISSSERSNDLENGAARRAPQERRGPLDSDTTTSTGKGVELTIMAPETAGTEGVLGTHGRRTSADAVGAVATDKAVGASSVNGKVLPPPRVCVRAEQSYDFIGRPAMAGHSIL